MARFWARFVFVRPVFEWTTGRTLRFMRIFLLSFVGQVLLRCQLRLGCLLDFNKTFFFWFKDSIVYLEKKTVKKNSEARITC